MEAATKQGISTDPLVEPEIKEVPLDEKKMIQMDARYIHETCYKEPTQKNIDRVVEYFKANVEKAHGFAANQFGLRERFFVYKDTKEEIHVIKNPKIQNPKKEIMNYEEGCLSLITDQGILSLVNTKRYDTVTVVHSEGTQTFTGTLAIVMQHEVDHLNGLTILDRRYKSIKKENTLKPNDKCHCGSGKKFKKCHMKFD